MLSERKSYCMLVVNCSVNTTCSHGSSVTGRHRYYPTVRACAVGTMNLDTGTILYQYCGTAMSLFLNCAQ